MGKMKTKFISNAFLLLGSYLATRSRANTQSLDLNHGGGISTDNPSEYNGGQSEYSGVKVLLVEVIALIQLMVVVRSIVMDRNMIQVNSSVFRSSKALIIQKQRF